MKSLSNWLQAARESRGLSLQEVEAVTRIRIRYLEALEMGDYGALPGGEAQVRGFIRRYASFLGLSNDEAMARYRREVYGEETEDTVPVVSPPSSAPTARIPARSWPRHGTQAIWVAGALGAAALLIAGGWWLVTRSGLLAHSEMTPTSVASTEAPSVLPSPVDTPIADQGPQATPTFPVAVGGGVTLTLEPLEHVWVRVTADAFVDEKMLAPGSSRTWTAEELVIVETGNGAGLIAVVNGQVQGPLCGRGEVCARGWGPEGELDVPPPSVPTPATEEE